MVLKTLPNPLNFAISAGSPSSCAILKRYKNVHYEIAVKKCQTASGSFEQETQYHRDGMWPHGRKETLIGTLKFESGCEPIELTCIWWRGKLHGNNCKFQRTTRARTSLGCLDNCETSSRFTLINFDDLRSRLANGRQLPEWEWLRKLMTNNYQ